MRQLGFGDVRQMGMEKATPGEVEDWMERLLPLRDPGEPRRRGVAEGRRPAVGGGRPGPALPAPGRPLQPDPAAGDEGALNAKGPG